MNYEDLMEYIMMANPALGGMASPLARAARGVPRSTGELGAAGGGARNPLNPIAAFDMVSRGLGGRGRTAGQRAGRAGAMMGGLGAAGEAAGAMSPENYMGGALQQVGQGARDVAMAPYAGMAKLAKMMGGGARQAMPAPAPSAPDRWRAGALQDMDPENYYEMEAYRQGLLDEPTRSSGTSWDSLTSPY